MTGSRKVGVLVPSRLNWFPVMQHHAIHRFCLSGLVALAIGLLNAELCFSEVLQASVRAGEPSYCQQFRQRLLTKENTQKYGLQLPSVLSRDDKPLVVLLHGFNSKSEGITPLVASACEAGYTCATFVYPNDQRIADSAELLSAELTQFANKYPERQIALVTYSMGGLVARACLENRSLDPGNVSKLIMIAPPNHGTSLASFAVAGDLWEHWIARKSGGLWDRTRDSIVDGLGEAASDLLPGSPFLMQLNGGPRNPAVRYTLILGAGAPIRQRELEKTRACLRNTVGLLTSKDTTVCVDEFEREYAELVHGKGDGIVAIKRAKLAGVEDIVVLPFSHLSVTEEAGVAATAAKRVVLDRLIATSR